MTAHLFSILNLSIPAALGVAIASLPLPASALTLNGSTGQWGTPTGTSFYSYQSVGNESQIRWGNPASDAGPSGLGFTGVGLTDVSPGQIFQLGTLRHFNNVVYGGTAASTSTLTFVLDFLELGPQSFDFALNIDETPNVQDACPYYSVTPCSDRISWASTLPSQKFSYNGGNYTLEVVGFSDQAGGEIINEFISQEGGTSQANFYAYGRLTSLDNNQSVPEPGVAIAFGFVGLSICSLRQSKQLQA